MQFSGWRVSRKYPAPVLPITLRFGNLRRLPKDYQGERHTVIVKQLPDRNDQNWVEFEEVPGPDPNPRRSPGVREYNIVFVTPYPNP